MRTFKQAILASTLAALAATSATAQTVPLEGDSVKHFTATAVEGDEYPMVSRERVADGTVRDRMTSLREPQGATISRGALILGASGPDAKQVLADLERTLDPDADLKTLERLKREKRQ